MVRYTIAMSIRIVCFVLAAVVGVVWETWWALALAAAAIILPYVAVVDANAGGDRYQMGREAAQRPQRELGVEQEESAAEPAQWWEDETDSGASPPPDGSAVISGEVVSEDEEDRR